MGGRSSRNKLFQSILSKLEKLCAFFGVHFVLIVVYPTGVVKPRSSSYLTDYTDRWIDIRDIQAHWWLAKKAHEAKKRALGCSAPAPMESFTREKLKGWVMALIKAAVPGLKRR